MLRAVLSASLLTVGLTLSPAEARECGPDQFAKLVDGMGAKLRAENERSEAELRANFKKLFELKGWSEDTAVDRGFQFLNDEQTRTLDAQASELLIRIDKLGDTQSKPATCARLDELKQASDQLIEVTAAKRAHIKAKLAVALKPKLAARPKANQAPAAPNSRPAVPANKPPVAKQPAVPRNNKTSQWKTETSTAPPPSPEVMAALPQLPAQPESTTFGSHEIRAAGRGLFGSLSAELASVIKFAFDSYGKPNGYVLGTEGGAAFLAGLRYGHGQLVTKQFGERKVYWQGPSIGTDFGITGSRVMVLVYNLDDPDSIFARFVGVEGAAYLVGGVGITFHKKGRIVLAPIRTGLGLRVGANLGYLKITPQRQFNPF